MNSEATIFVLSLAILFLVGFILLQKRHPSSEKDKISEIMDFQSIRDKVDSGFDNLMRNLNQSAQAQNQATDQLSSNVSELYTLFTKGRSGHQGQFGESSLRLILENSGIVPDVGFEEQKQIGSEKPDIIISLPEGRKVVIDSKVSLADYSKYLTADSDDERKSLKKKHITAIKNHIKTLSSTSYRDLYGSDSLDLVVMYMSVEGAYILACEDDLLSQAIRNKIAIVGPTTLIALLQIISRAWSNKKQSDDISKIIAQATALYDDSTLVLESFEEFVNHYDKSKDSIDKGIKRAKKLRQIFRMKLRLIRVEKVLLGSFFCNFPTI